MLEYFDILDKANVESEEIIVQETDLDKLRDDKHIPYNKNLLKFLKSYQEKYIKAPKLN
jgi:Asp-tRNA(Asn)/Glu-tRNA(Gln) amidotransferase C subunit